MYVIALFLLSLVCLVTRYHLAQKFDAHIMLFTWDFYVVQMPTVGICAKLMPCFELWILHILLFWSVALHNNIPHRLAGLANNEAN